MAGPKTLRTLSFLLTYPDEQTLEAAELRGLWMVRFGQQVDVPQYVARFCIDSADARSRGQQAIGTVGEGHRALGRVAPVPALVPADLSSLEVEGHEVEGVFPVRIEQDRLAQDEGRLYVVEMRAYMRDAAGGGEDEALSRVVVLSDDDGDGFGDACDTSDGLDVDGDGATRLLAVTLPEPPGFDRWFARLQVELAP